MPRPLVLAILAVLVLSGCGGSATETAAEPTPSATSASPEESPEAQESTGGQQLEPEAEPEAVPDSLDFTGTTVAGAEFEGATLAGRPTLLWFWAPWCPSCRGQIPQVEGLAEQYDGELNVVGVGSLDSAEAIAGFAGDVDGVTHLEDADGELWKRFGVSEQSSFVLLDSDGSEAFRTGYGGSDELGDRVADAVG
ncbi:TlpA family protein disulfide reductase [Nocardioides coralli]|uniref:TlpA family protein disulfide reductase n=1 Tax=Nocardioides coralli TaxID=2872154 RepID=UPI001CA45242|nr:redoxin domain-containing protein [Nocardioides coralli]QZY29551.1 redoxin domain-containing protein [Nocardioides coralli]